MSKRRKILLWIGLCVSLPAAAYVGLSFVFDVWLEASKDWPAEKTSILALGAIALVIALGALFFYCFVSLMEEANRAYRDELEATSMTVGRCEVRAHVHARPERKRVP